MSEIVEMQQNVDILQMRLVTSSAEDLASPATTVLKKGEGRTLKKGGLWVYDNEIASVKGDYQNGDIIGVEDFDGYFMGYGYINDASKIRIRMLTRGGRETRVTPSFLKQRVRDAWTYRKKVIDTSACRVIFGDADFLPGLTVDKYDDILVVESLALGTGLSCRLWWRSLRKTASGSVASMSEVTQRYGKKKDFRGCAVFCLRRLIRMCRSRRMASAISLM